MSNRDLRPLLVSAAPFEAEPTLAACKKAGLDVSYASCGIGPLHAAKAEHNLKELAAGREVIFIGTCGSFLPGQGLQLVHATKTIWFTPCLQAGIAWAIDGLYPVIDLPPPPKSAPPLPKKIIATSSTISRERAYLRNTETLLPFPEKDLVENCELYACAEGLKAARSLLVVMAITNEIGPNARSQWKNNFGPAAELTAEYVVKYLQNY